MKKLRTSEEKFDYANVFDNIVNAIAGYLNKYNLDSMVLGISGGIDSTVNAAIGKEVCKRTGKKLIGISLMTDTNESDEVESALLVGKEFCTEYRTWQMNDEYESLNSLCEEISGTSDSIARGNIKARMRMMILFDASAKNKGIVFSGANQTEVLLGFSTLGADSLGAIAPLSELFKHEVYEFAHWIKDNVYPDSIALEKSISLTPTDGNGVMAGGDLAQIAPGCTYDDVDDILIAYLRYSKQHIIQKDVMEEWDRINLKYGNSIVDGVIRRHRNSQFKRWFLPLVIDPNTGELTQNDLTKL